MEVLKQYPIVPKPEIFGLHDNADITCDQNETYDLFATVLSLQPRVSAGVGASREDVIMSKCEAISAKLPAAFGVEAVQQKYPTMYEESMNTVLAQECIRYSYSHLLGFLISIHHTSRELWDEVWSFLSPSQPIV
jgi:dynein heavy chain, axonemal